ncbi:flagellar hook-basal body complex protein FliE [Oceanirhabdus sp. W0125-5]|uniref:flagellar hook-basal body complex protein FliE n=1 Tax=Oceanirhabdus sp. W0125-5 TaxID=2999116 RepID=UPI0022F30D26|nr:flagellar hook-basal body complex protein FliE [Oceanirhabdus sp. W0125-5]WBW95433.1 flagellar hook-basal body complex protein FliE [Oceanirhabdus sp. W0125-5]
MKINNISSLQSFTLGNEKENKSEKSIGFGQALKEQLDKVNEKQINSEQMTEALVRGEDVEIHDVMMSSKEAYLSMQMALEVKNKLVKAYQEFNQMQI